MVTPLGIGKIQPVGIHRKFKGTYPMTLYLFKVDNDVVAKSLQHQEIEIDGKTYQIREHLNSQIFRCSKCQELGHLSKKCTNPKKCVRCAGQNCEIGNCKKGIRKCANCGEGHSAAFKQCPVLITKQKELFKNEKASRTEANFASTQKRQMADISNIQNKLHDVTEIKTEIRALQKEIGKLKERNEIYESKIGDLIEFIVWGTEKTTNRAAYDEVIFEALKRLRGPSDKSASQSARQTEPRGNPSNGPSTHPSGTPHGNTHLTQQVHPSDTPVYVSHTHTPPTLAAIVNAHRDRASKNNTAGQRK